MAETTFTFKDATGTTKTALAGANGSTQLAPAAILYALDGTVLIGQKASAASLPVVIASDQSAVPVSLSGGATAANQSTANTSLATLVTQTDGVETSLTSIDGKLPALGQALAAASVPVVLPAATITTLTPPAAITGFATAVKQPALGTAGTASADVLSVQGIASMTALKVDGSAVTQPVSGTVTANIAAGTNNIGDVDVLTLPALPVGNNNIGDVDIASIAAGDNNIGNVDIVSLPALAAGTNNIGDVDVLTLPALPAGSNNIGDVDIASIAAGDNNIGNVDVVTLPALAAGTNNIGDVDVLTLPAGTVAGGSSLPAGTNNIGDVDVLTLPALPTGTNSIGTVQPGNTQNTTPWLVSPVATTVDVTVTRPADTTAYAANDELSDSTSAPAVITLTGMARTSGGTLRLVSARLIDSANQSTKLQALVFLFDTTTTPGNDNAAFAPSDSVMNTCVGILPFNIWYPGDDTSGASGNAISPYLGPELRIKTSGSANLFARIKVLNAYTPTSAEALKLRIDVVQD